MERKVRTGLAACLGMLLLIIDSRTVIAAAQEGIGLCLQTVIPALFPFFVLSILLTSSLGGSGWKILQPLEKWCRIPTGSGSLLLIGLLGGYPTGAQAVASAYESGLLPAGQARRMMGFCSNAGPSFIFGIVALQFSQKGIAWVLWVIHILAVLAVGRLLPGGSTEQVALPAGKPLTLPQAVKQGASVMAGVCAWVVLFRIVLVMLNRWCLWLLPQGLRICIAGLLELTVGCTNLPGLGSESLMFVVCAGLLAFGGLCVAMQTSSVSGSLGLGMYLPGKLLHGIISMALAYLYQLLFFQEKLPASPALTAGCGIFLLVMLWNFKEALNKSARACSEGFFVRKRSGKGWNT